MANSRRGNKLYIDTTGVVATQRTKIAYILFTPSADDDQIVFRETASDVDILVIQGPTGKKTDLYDLALVPLVFNNGIYIQTLSSGAKAVLVTTEKGE